MQTWSGLVWSGSGFGLISNSAYQCRRQLHLLCLLSSGEDAWALDLLGEPLVKNGWT
jgi:hypothetical protein